MTAHGHHLGWPCVLFTSISNPIPTPSRGHGTRHDLSALFMIPYDRLLAYERNLPTSYRNMPITTTAPATTNTQMTNLVSNQYPWVRRPCFANRRDAVRQAYQPKSPGGTGKKGSGDRHEDPGRCECVLTTGRPDHDGDAPSGKGRPANNCVERDDKSWFKDIHSRRRTIP